MTEKINTKQLKPVATALSATIDNSTFVMTLQLKDQNNNNIGSAQTVDLPLETMVVSGEYDADNKKIILTLQNGQTIDIPVGDLISGLQTEITSDNMLDADLVDDTTSTHKFTSSSEKSTWNGKQDTLTAGINIQITGTTISATDTTYTGSDGVTLTGTNFTNSGVRSIATGATNGTISVNTGGTSAEVAVYGLGSAAYTASTAYDAAGAASTAETNAKNYADGLASNYATAAQGALADTAVQPGDLATVATTGLYSDLSGTPTIPTVNDATITITQGGVTKGSFTLNQASGDTIALDAGGGSGLPDQTGNAGKFLTTDGTDASWSNKPLVNTATGTNALTVGGVASTYNQVTNIGLLSQAYSYNNVLVGYNTSAYRTSVAIGAGANAGGDSPYQKQGNVSIGYASTTRGNYSIAIGSYAKAYADGAIQITATNVAANQTNSDANTFKVGNANGNFEMMSADGTIPEARLADTTSATAGQVLTLDSNLDALWATPTASVSWGGITGTLSDQTDLYNALDAKSGCILRRW